MINQILQALPMVLAVLFAAIPIIVTSSIDEPTTPAGRIFLVVNVLGWSIVLLSLIVRQVNERRMRKFALQAGIFSAAKSGNTLKILLHDIARRERALSMPHLEKRIHSGEELSSALEEIVDTAYTLLDAESAELALYESESSMYHSAFVKGRPFRSSAQAMLSGSVTKDDPDLSTGVLIHPISFAGNILGTLRIALKKGKYPDGSDRKVVSLLAAQAALALTNAQYSDQLLRLKTASDESLRAKTGFLANLSHELRAPLGIILNGIEVLLDRLCGELNNEQEETLLMVRSNSEHLLELVNDVLDYAKVESGKLEPKQVVIDVNELLQDLIAIVRKQAEEKEHTITLTGSNDALALRCDRRHFRQILLNMLTNAIKYTQDKGQIDVWAERTAANRIEVHVKDTGIGIAPENHSKVFAAFERVEHSYALSQGGTGLGMPLTKRLTERNGGRIDFSSALGEGTNVWISFPAVQASEISKGESLEAQTAPLGKGEQILLIKNEHAEGTVLEKYLTSLGYKTKSAIGYDESMRRMGSESFDLIFFENSHLQSWMAGLIEQIRSETTSQKIPILLLTSRAFAFDVEEFLRLGIDRCLIKPARLFTIAETVRQLLDGNYSGAVVDEDDVTATHDDLGSKTLPVSAKRLIGVDDILH